MINRIFRKIISIVAIQILKQRLKKKGVKIENNVEFFHASFEGSNSIEKYSIVNYSEIGYGTYIGRNTILIRTQIGKYCSIGSNVSIAIGKHPTCKFASTHPAFFSIKKQAGFTYVNENLFEELSYVKPNINLLIGNDVWIGTNVTILDGVTIGDGAIIGASTLVTKNIEPYSINVGSPSKVIRYRFSEDEILFLNELKWWNKDEKWIKKHAIYFQDIEILKENILKTQL